MHYLLNLPIEHRLRRGTLKANVVLVPPLIFIRRRRREGGFLLTLEMTPRRRTTEEEEEEEEVEGGGGKSVFFSSHLPVCPFLSRRIKCSCPLSVDRKKDWIRLQREGVNQIE